MKTPTENKAIDYKEMKDAVTAEGFEQVQSGSVANNKVWGRKGNLGPYTLKGAYSIIQANTVTKSDPRPEKKEIKKSKKDKSE